MHKALVRVTLLLLLLPCEAWSVEPQCPGGSSPDLSTLLCEDFDSGLPSIGSKGKFLEYSTGKGSFTLESNAGYAASPGMRAHWEQGQVSAGWILILFGKVPADGYRVSHIQPNRNFREIYWRFYHRTDSAWAGGLTNKLTRAFIFGDPTHWGQAMIGHLWFGPRLFIDPVSGVKNAGGVDSLVTTAYNDFPNFEWLGSIAGTTPIYSDANAGRWFCIEAHVKLNTPGQSDGLMEFWVDGELNARRSGLDWVGEWQDYGLNAVQFDNYHNGGSPVARDRYLDNLVISTERIKCIGDVTPPSPKKLN